MDKNISCSSSGHKLKEKLEGKLQFEQSTAKRSTIGMLSETEDYLNGRKIFDTFHFLLGHLIIDKPTNPVQYLYQLLDDCILFRSGFKEPRLLWTKRHIDAIFENVSTGTPDLVSLNRYKIAMKSLGTPYYNPCPVQRLPGYIDRETFCAEALNSLENALTCIMSTSIRRACSACNHCGTRDT